MTHATTFAPWAATMILGAHLQGCATPDLDTPRDPDLAAIFCGEPGTETSAAYAQALDRDLTRLEARGLTTAQSIAVLERRACRN